MSFVAFSCTMGNWWENPCIPYMMKYTAIGWKLYGEKSLILYKKSISTNFPGSTHTKGFVAFSRTMRNWWGNTCIFHMIRYTIRWESNGKKAPILWRKKYEYQFPPDFPHTMGFVAFSHTVGNLWGNACISHMLKYTRGWELDGKKTPMPYYGKSMIIDSPDFSHTMGFVAFFRTVGNLWGNPCSSHIMTSVNFFLCFEYQISHKCTNYIYILFNRRWFSTLWDVILNWPISVCS